jgi:predicted NBD/HSP70 family sugar kinase
VSNFIFVVADVGIGGGLFLNGELYRGAGGFAGEIGHTSISPQQTRPCRCGNRGCWENLSNQYSLCERIRARLEVGRESVVPELCAQSNSTLTLSIITQAAKARDEQTLEALVETGQAMGLGFSNLINIFNPEMIVLGGSLSMVGDYLLSGIKMVVEQRALTEARNSVKIVQSQFGTDAIVIGAVALVVEAILSVPNRVEKIFS